MITTKTRCRSKNPSACPFHGSPEKSLNALVDNKDIQGYISYREGLDYSVEVAQHKVKFTKHNVDRRSNELATAQIDEERNKNEIIEAEEALGSKGIEASYEDYVDHQTQLVPDFYETPESTHRTQFKHLKEIVLGSGESIKSNRNTVAHLGSQLNMRKFDLEEAEKELQRQKDHRDQALGKSYLSVTQGYAVLQTHMTAKGQKAFENYNNEVSTILKSKLPLSAQKAKIETVKAELVSYLHEASNRLYTSESPRSKETISGVEVSYDSDPVFGNSLSANRAEDNQAFYLLYQFRRAPINTLLTM